MLSVSGSQLSRNDILSMINGEPALNATIEESRLTDVCADMRSEFELLCNMHTEPDSAMICRLHALLAAENDDHDYRRGTPQIREMALTPPHSSEISGLMRHMEIDLAASRADSIDRAVLLHDMVMSIWPFNEYNDATAYAVMSYSLLSAGYPLPSIELTQYEHRRLTAEYIHKGTSAGLTSMLLINLINEYENLK